MLLAQAQTASLVYRHGGDDYLLNLIDTPGHVGARPAAAKTRGPIRTGVCLHKLTLNT